MTIDAAVTEITPSQESPRLGVTKRSAFRTARNLRGTGMNSDCVLCGIRDGTPRVKKLHEDDLVYAMDVPKDLEYYLGPVHFLVIPNQHVQSALFIGDRDAALAGRLFSVAARLVREKGIAESGFRLATNTGPDANQTVFHFHLHCIGGRKLGDEG